MSKDKPFRELQFSSAQLIVVFLAILVLGVFIFLLGISVGKKQTRLAAGAAVPAKTETVAPTTKPEEVKPQDKPADKPAVKPGEPGGGGSEAKPKPAAIAPNGVMTTAKPADAKPVAVTKPGTTAKTAVTKPVTTEAEDAKPKGRFYVQIGAVTDKPAAKAFGERVELLGFPSRILDPLAADKKAVFRVRIGPYETRAEADDAQGKIAASLKKKKTDFFIVVD